MARSVIINGVTYPDVPSVNIPAPTGSTPVPFYETSDANAVDGHVLSGKTYYKGGGKSTGSMPNNGDVSGTISTKDGTVSVPAGYTSGGTVGLLEAAKSPIVSGNIKYGASILGVNGASYVLDTRITSSDRATASDILSGKKAFVNGQEITGTATFPVISQDATTKVLSIT